MMRLVRVESLEQGRWFLHVQWEHVLVLGQLVGVGLEQGRGGGGGVVLA